MMYLANSSCTEEINWNNSTGNMYFFTRFFLLGSAEYCAHFESIYMFNVQDLRSVSTKYDLFS